jgi:undecaprenyl-diphosphatase
MLILELLKTVLLGIVEGITEWLPISSTGHMILFNEFLSLDVSPAFWELFEVVIQLGAILAVIVLFFRKLNPFALSKSAEEKKSTWILWLKVIVAILPSGVIGVLADDFLDAHLGNYVVVSLMLIVYGVAFILIERRKNAPVRVESVDALSWRMALAVGAFQVLSLIPGTSRSGATILGAMLLGLTRTAASEFSFFMAIPTMAGASLVRGYKFLDYVAESGVSVPTEAWLVLGAGFLTAFVVSLASIKFLMDFVKRHTFTAFGIYRIALGILVLAYFAILR